MTEEQVTTQRVRRRASRAAGPPKGASASPAGADDSSASAPGADTASATGQATKPAPKRAAKKT
ncbi:MAG: mammalian cell entry protein, partial [Mycobacteriaceae bacterium]|nr:mammalian cell entry protein [Mycobacteriaceae bacterium]